VTSKKIDVNDRYNSNETWITRTAGTTKSLSYEKYELCSSFA